MPSESRSVLASICLVKGKGMLGREKRGSSPVVSHSAEQHISKIMTLPSGISLRCRQVPPALQSTLEEVSIAPDNGLWLPISVPTSDFSPLKQLQAPGISACNPYLTKLETSLSLLKNVIKILFSYKAKFHHCTKFRK